MAEILGKEIELGVAVEATRGSAESAAAKWVRNVDANVVERAVHANDDTSRGVFEDGEGRRVVQKHIEGDVSGIVHADAIGYFLGNVYGKVTSTLVAGSVYSHLFELKQSATHQSLSLFAKDGSVQQQVFNNCMINSYELNVALDDYVRNSISFMGSEAASNSDTPSYDTEYDFIARDVTVKLADTEAGLSGATASKAKEATVTFTTDVIRDHVVGSYTPDDNYNSRLGIEGSMTLNYVDNTFKDLFLGDDAKYMSITITGAADIGGGENPEIEIVLNKVQVTDWNRSGGKDELVTQEVSFKAYYNETDGEASKVTLNNLTSAYANVPTS